MKRRSLFIFFILSFNSLHSCSSSFSKQSLDTLQFNRAGVLPLVDQIEKHTRTKKKEKVTYAILSRESRGKDKDTYDACSGAREKKQTPMQTAAMEFWQEGMLKDTLKWSQHKTEQYIKLATGNTEHILVTHLGSPKIPKNNILFISRLPKRESQKLLKKFYTALNKNKEPEFTEKDRIALVKWDELTASIKNSQSPDVKVIGHVVDSKTNKMKPEIITVRPVLVEELQGYCKGLSYRTGKNSKIRFY